MVFNEWVFWIRRTSNSLRPSVGMASSAVPERSLLKKKGETASEYRILGSWLFLGSGIALTVLWCSAFRRTRTGGCASVWSLASNCYSVVSIPKVDFGEIMFNENRNRFMALMKIIEIVVGRWWTARDTYSLATCEPKKAAPWMSVSALLSKILGKREM